MKMIKLTIALLTFILLTACQSTNHVNSQSAVVQTQVTSINSHTVPDTTEIAPIVLSSFKERAQKRNLTSDAKLAYSLANRSVPQDQLMMLAFEQKRANSLFIQTGYFVDIRGSRAQDPNTNRTQVAWQHFDANAKTIAGPR